MTARTDGVEIEDVEYVRTFPSGKAILVVIDGKERSIPVSHVLDDSEIFAGTDNEVGTLVISRWLADREGLDSPGTGTGLVLRRPPRSRLSPPEMLLSVGRLKRIRERLGGTSQLLRDGKLTADGSMLVVTTEDGSPLPFAIFDDECNHDDVRFLASSTRDVSDLVDEVERLRSFVERVTKKR